MKYKQPSLRRPTAALLIVSAGFLIITGHAVAAGDISRGVRSTEQLQTGQLVSLDPNASDYGKAATSTSASRLVGVVSSSSLIQIPASGQPEIQVVTSGTTHALVSTINGDIRKGDYITASPIAGIGMKATESARVIGQADADLNLQTASSQTVKDSSGKDHQIRLGSVPVQVDVSNYTGPPATSRLIPAFLQNFAQATAGHQVQPIRIIISSLILLAGLLVTTVIIYTGIRTGIIAIGRQPLASVKIRKGVTQVIGLGLIMLIGATVVAYLMIIV